MERPLTGIEAQHYIEDTLGFGFDELHAFPKYFLIETINVCNARCIMCGIDFAGKKKEIMSETTFDRITQELGSRSDAIKKVMLYLDGEPLLDKGLHHKIKKMKDAGIRKVNIASNASLLDMNTASLLIKAGLDEIYITVDSLKKEIYEAIRVGLKFETVYNNIINFISLRNEMNPNLAIRIQMILQEINFSEGESFVKHWKPLLNPEDQIAVQKAHNWASAAKVLKFGDEETMNFIPCIAPWGTCVIHANGDVPLCCMDSKTKIFLGNVNKEKIAKIWASDAMEEVRRKHLSGRRAQIPICNGCTLWREDKRHIEKPAVRNNAF